MACSGPSSAYGLPWGDAVEKDAGRRLAMQPAVPGPIAPSPAYCASDVDKLAALARVMWADLDHPRHPARGLRAAARA